jgi:predicted GNAT family acetyltransferase
MQPARPATSRDLDRLGELYLAMGRSFAALDPAYQLAMDAGRMWREHLLDGFKSDRIRVPVTLGESGQAVSFLVARVASAPPGSALSQVGLIEGAFVEEECRRQGRLRAMVADAMRWFAVKRVPHVDLIADIRDPVALAAWRALGFSDLQLVLRARVPSSD